MPLTDLYDENFPHGTEVGYSRGCRGSDGCLHLADEQLLTCREVHVAREKDPNIAHMDRWAKVRYDQLNLPIRDLGTPAPTATPAPRPTPRFADIARIVPPTNSTSTVNTNGTAVKDDHEAQPPIAPVASAADADTHTDPMPAVKAATIAPAKDDHDATDTAPVVPAAGIDNPEKAKRLPAGLALDDPRFPHGTTAGFARGCKDEDDCPGDPETAITCREASRQYQRDYAAMKVGGVAKTAAANPKTSAGDSEPIDAPSVDQATVSPAEHHDTPHTSEPAGVVSDDSAPTTPDAAADGRGDGTEAAQADSEPETAPERSTAAALLRELRESEGRELHEVDGSEVQEDLNAQDPLQVEAPKVEPTEVDTEPDVWEQALPGEAIEPQENPADQMIVVTQASVDEHAATLATLRDELANAERAASELKTTHRREHAALVELHTGDREAFATEEARLTNINTSLAARVHELEGLLEETTQTLANLAHDASATPADERSQELVPATPEPVALAEAIQPTGGATHAAQLGLTINPTEQAGVSLGFTLPGSGEQFAIRIALSASDKPGLGDVAISVGSN